MVEHMENAHSLGHEGRRLGTRGGRFSFALPTESFEHQERPQRSAEVTDTRLMLRHDSLEEALVEDASVEKPRTEDRLAHALFERSPKPARERHRKAHFRPVEDVVRKVVLKRALEQELAFSASKLRLRRQRGCPLDELVVQNRHPHLERVSHAGPIHFREDVADEIGLEIEILNARQRMLRRILPVSSQDLDRTVAAEILAESIAEQSAPQRIAQDGDTVEVAFAMSRSATRREAGSA